AHRGDAASNRVPDRRGDGSGSGSQPPDSVIMDKIETSKDLDAETEKELDAAVQDFKTSGSY
ncbi:MAG: hypothetical protein ACE1Y1_07245, partial [Nitrosomonadaceae bacterium]